MGYIEAVRLLAQGAMVKRADPITECAAVFAAFAATSVLRAAPTTRRRHGERRIPGQVFRLPFIAIIPALAAH